ncbi:uncharacterized protein NEMAJ01_0586 [Nematocida major]|uniref:uncharacterized protein n=1 Tax=Nematocida major TaxID=1912982 RepID=UPI0020072837|nr:uncharacterized protein NEMAJ01_0586 [Nematocida major]KAH9385690.1 hypothetical protein NEMAJ01_0586 [Nematocida major]
MANTISLRFPFKLDGYEHKAEVSTPVIRKENVVTFSLPFNATVSVDSEKAYTVYYKRAEERKKFMYVVTIEFKSINDAISFSGTPIVHLSHQELILLENINRQLEEVSDLLEASGNSWRKRRKCSEPDEEGYFTA